MRALTANGAIPRNDAGNISSWLRRLGLAWAARTRPAKHQKNFVQADTAAFVSAFMRIG